MHRLTSLLLSLLIPTLAGACSSDSQLRAPDSERGDVPEAEIFSCETVGDNIIQALGDLEVMGVEVLQVAPNTLTLTLAVEDPSGTRDVMEFSTTELASGHVGVFSMSAAWGGAGDRTRLSMASTDGVSYEGDVRVLGDTFPVGVRCSRTATFDPSPEDQLALFIARRMDEVIAAGKASHGHDWDFRLDSLRCIAATASFVDDGGDTVAVGTCVAHGGLDFGNSSSVFAISISQIDPGSDPEAVFTVTLLGSEF